MTMVIMTVLRGENLEDHKVRGTMKTRVPQNVAELSSPCSPSESDRSVLMAGIRRPIL